MDFSEGSELDMWADSFREGSPFTGDAESIQDGIERAVYAGNFLNDWIQFTAADLESQFLNHLPEPLKQFVSINANDCEISVTYFPGDLIAPITISRRNPWCRRIEENPQCVRETPPVLLNDNFTEESAEQIYNNFPSSIPPRCPPGLPGNRNPDSP